MRAPTMAPGLTLQVCACRIARVMSPCDAHEVEFASATALGVLMPTMAHATLFPASKSLLMFAHDVFVSRPPVVWRRAGAIYKNV